MPPTSRESHHKRSLRKGPFVVIPAFLFLWLIGVATGEPSRVLEQALQVCLSCIGIG
ncbi:CD1871A family CXXC motif-containing protein [Thiovibrio frasassiensis]|uniref:CD1871A family CXXC motif-containing protein n=1 Tax=Thiovibrio frasassiensis TaxID=2984131 RepID=A0A9X4MDZ0_9BACT|nr:CD1871A family CXXC motif-containing protein [Thiovibrio frasassiensis]MDG4475814.1 CD1871A family CXXC motif-containing protein [Thiovibrio frasassiensis]